MRQVGAQGHQVQAVAVLPERVQVEAAERGIEVPARGEEEVLALAVEAGVPSSVKSSVTWWTSPPATSYRRSELKPLLSGRA
jgi:hypothetical protein